MKTAEKLQDKVRGQYLTIHSSVPWAVQLVFFPCHHDLVHSGEEEVILYTAISFPVGIEAGESSQYGH